MFGTFTVCSSRQRAVSGSLETPLPRAAHGKGVRSSFWKRCLPWAASLAHGKVECLPWAAHSKVECLPWATGRLTGNILLCRERLTANMTLCREHWCRLTTNGVVLAAPFGHANGRAPQHCATPSSCRELTFVCRRPQKLSANCLPWGRFLTLGKHLFADRKFAEWTLQRASSRQTVCREEYGLCREFWAHGKRPGSGSASFLAFPCN